MHADTGDRENAGNFAVLQDGRLVPAEKALLMPERGYSSCVQEPDYGFRPTEDSVNVRDVRRYSLDKSRKSRSQRSRLRKIRDGLFPVEAGLEPDAEENIPYGAMPVLSAPAVTALDIPDETDSRTEAILSEIQRIQSKFGVTIDELEIILNYRIKLSRLLITRRNEIFMSDFDNREIKMDHLSKTVFFLYLRHPEGIRFKDLPDLLLPVFPGIVPVIVVEKAGIIRRSPRSRLAAQLDTGHAVTLESHYRHHVVLLRELLLIPAYAAQCLVDCLDRLIVYR